MASRGSAFSDVYVGVGMIGVAKLSVGFIESCIMASRFTSLISDVHVGVGLPFSYFVASLDFSLVSNFYVGVGTIGVARLGNG
jgi:hypothetical protein